MVVLAGEAGAEEEEPREAQDEQAPEGGEVSLFREEITIEGATVLKPMAASIVKSALIAPKPAPIVTKAPILAPVTPAPRPVPRISAPTPVRPASPKPLPSIAIATRPPVPKLRPVAPTRTAPTMTTRPGASAALATPTTAPSPAKLFAESGGGGASAALFREAAAPPAPSLEEYLDDDRGAVGVSVEAPDPIWYAAAAGALVLGIYLWRKRKS